MHVAIIPARGGSKGIPGKNINDFCGLPLIAWTICQVLDSKLVNEVYVTTDDSKIAMIANDYGAKVIDRPAILAIDTAAAESALLHAIIEIEKTTNIDLIVYPQVTSPLREVNDIDNAIHQFYSENADSLFSATILKDFCVWKKTNGQLNSLTFDYKNRGRRQERENYYLENGSIYLFKPEIIKQNNNRLGGKISIYDMPLWKSYEIDEPEDIETCAYYMKTKILKNNHD